MGGGSAAQSLTQAQAVTDARNYDMVVGLVNTFQPYLGAMRTANPSVKVIAYMNGAYAQKNQGTLYPEAWYAHDAAGHKITSVSQGNYLMDVSNSGWATDRAKKCSASMGKGFNGCYLDLLGTATLDPGYVSSLPINPATNQVWTAPGFIAATSAIGTKVKLANSGGMIVGNGLSNGDLYFDPAAGPTSRLLDGMDGANAQGWNRGTTQAPDKYRDQASWQHDVDMLPDAGAKGRSVMTMTKLWVAATDAQRLSVHRYALASFLLGTDGNQYFFFSDTGSESAAAPDYPYDHVNVGAPAGAYRIQGGAYVRQFSAGVAVVNPTNAPVTVSLGGTYRSLDGQQMSSVTLAPNTGDVFTP